MEGISYVLKNGANVKSLYGDITDDKKLKVLNNAFKDGKITEEELQTLEENGINTDPIKNAKNSTKEGSKANNAKKDIGKVAADLKSKYVTAAASGDIYSASNPELKALQKALNDGAVADLGEQGYSKNEIVEIISKAFSVGIKNTGDGKYQVPHGHGAEAKDIYKQFSTELLKAAGDSEEIQASRAKLAQLNNQIRSNTRSIQQLEVVIVQLQDEIQDNIDKAIEDSKDIEENHKEKTKDAVAENIQKYTNANGNMTYEEFEKDLAGDLDDIADETDSALSKTVKTMLLAEKQMAVLTSQLGRMKGLMDLNVELSAQAVAEEANLKELIEAQANTPDADCSPCDPIGFVDPESGVRYDFFMDKDGNDKLSNENEFLGAENGFNEMAAFDKDGNGTVDLEEMAQAGVKVVVTYPSGNQKIQDIKDAFPDGLDVGLDSYKKSNTKMDNGNTLLGTFDVNFGGNKIEGYQTLDELDWLDANYEFSDKVEGTGRYIQGEDTALEAEDFTQRYTELSDKANIFRQDMDAIWEKVGYDSESVKNLTDKAEKDAAQKAEKINADFEKTAKAIEDKEAAEQAGYEAKKEAEAQKLEEQKAEEQKAEEQAENPFLKKKPDEELA